MVMASGTVTGMGLPARRRATRSGTEVASPGAIAARTIAPESTVTNSDGSSVKSPVGPVLMVSGCMIGWTSLCSMTALASSEVRPPSDTAACPGTPAMMTSRAL